MTKFFISHSSAHKPFCLQVKELLNTSGHECWIDAFDIHGGEAIPQAIVDGIYSSDYFLLVLSPEAVQSKWVNWELVVATYREVSEIAGRPFIIPAVRAVSNKPTIIAHKNHLDFTGSADDAVTKLIGATGGAFTPPSLAQDVHIINMIATSLDTNINSSTRRLEETFWKHACNQRSHRYSFFPAALPGHGVSVYRDKFIVVTDEKTYFRQTVTEIRTNGKIIASETNYLFIDKPLVHASRLIQKISRFVEISNNLFAELEWGTSFKIDIQILGVDRDFRLLCDPTGLQGLNPLQIPNMTHFSLPRGSALEASRTISVVQGGQRPEDLIGHTNELQADLFHMLRIPGVAGYGIPDISVRFKQDHVSQYVTKAIGNEWIE